MNLYTLARAWSTAMAIFFCLVKTTDGQVSMERHRPQFHFSPQQKWMNDPNGMLYYKGTYHLFFQYYPEDVKWGPMHWGHATSADMINWNEQPVALYPDSLGYIFSGSAVVDERNTSGFSKDGTPPLVAVFTHHDPQGEKEKRNDYQNQSLAYSLDQGKTWQKYAGNPVLKNPGITDFRDPKVAWYEPGKRWIMTLATKDRIAFYSSPDLKNWTKESEFGKDVGAHGGVWECPDLFEFDHNGRKIWVLLVSINPGGPNAGSATQYFTGQFNGSSFTATDTITRWMDYGTDNYAGVTFSNTGDEKILMGWMNNWQYADRVPTEKWRGAMTIPRKLGLKEVGNKIFLTSMPLMNNKDSITPMITRKNFSVRDSAIINTGADPGEGLFRLQFTTRTPDDFELVLSNESGNKLLIGFEKSSRRFYIDRKESGNTNFEKGFSGRHYAPRISMSKTIKLDLIADAASVELFADDGLTVMTEVFFPDKPISTLQIKSPAKITIMELTYTSLSKMQTRNAANK